MIHSNQHRLRTSLGLVLLALGASASSVAQDSKKELQAIETELKREYKLLREATNLPITVAEDPLTCVVLGTGKILDDPTLYEKVLMSVARN